MNKDKLDALLMKMDGDSAYAEAVAEQALEGIRELLARVETLEAENAALRARAVPEVVWDGMLAEVGGFILEVRGGFVGWSWAIWRNGTIVSNGGGMTGGTEGQAKAHCESAFLRLVGVK